MTPLQYTSKTVATAESNISKWSKEEARIVEAAAAVVTEQLMKKSKARAWFPKAERELYVLYLAKRKSGLKVSTLWFCIIMAGLIEKLYPEDDRRKTCKASWRWASKWAKKNNISKRRRSNSKNESVEERLPKIRRFHKKLQALMQDPAPVSRSSPAASSGGGRGASPETPSGGSGGAVQRGGASGAGGSEGAVQGGGASGAGGAAGVVQGTGASGEVSVHADSKYGRFPLKLRKNVDQVCRRELRLVGFRCLWVSLTLLCWTRWVS